MTLAFDKISGPKMNKMVPKKTNIKVADATTVSWKILRNFGNFKLSKFLSLLPNFDATLSVNQIANCCWWPIANPPLFVKRCVGSTVKFELTAQYNPHIVPIPNVASNGLSRNVGISKIITVIVAACCTIICPVINNVLTFVILRNTTKKIFTKNPTKSADVAIPTNSGKLLAILSFAAVNPK